MCCAWIETRIAPRRRGKTAARRVGRTATGGALFFGIAD